MTIVEFPWLAEERRQAERQKIYDQYQKNHVVCPKCNSDWIESTTMGFDIWSGDKDFNKATCSKCNWSGVVDDLISITIRKQIAVNPRAINSKIALGFIK